MKILIVVFALAALAAVSFAATAQYCSQFHSCSTCAEDMGCKWCNSNSRCFVTGSSESVCPNDDWSITPSYCPAQTGGGGGCCCGAALILLAGLAVVGFAAARKG